MHAIIEKMRALADVAHALVRAAPALVPAPGWEHRETKNTGGKRPPALRRCAALRFFVTPATCRRFFSNYAGTKCRRLVSGPPADVEKDLGTARTSARAASAGTEVQPVRAQESSPLA